MALTLTKPGAGTTGTGYVTTGGSISSGTNIASSFVGVPNKNVLAPCFVGGVTNRLIPQKGGRIGRDDFQFDTAVMPYKVARVSGWLSLVPGKGASLSDINGLYCWDPVRDISIGAVFADVNLYFRGVINDQIPDPLIIDSVSLQTTTINNNQGESADFAYYAPQTEYRYIVRGDPLGANKYSSITNSSQRKIKIVRYFIRSTGDDGLAGLNPNDESQDDQAAAAAQLREFLVPLVVEECVSTSSFQVGPYYGCVDIVTKTLKGPFSV